MAVPIKKMKRRLGSGKMKKKLVCKKTGKSVEDEKWQKLL